MKTYTCTVPASRLSAFRRNLIRSGGAVLVSTFCEAGYYVTYTATAALR